MNKTNLRTIYLKDYTPPAFLIDTISLHVALDEEFTTVRSVLKIHRNPQSADLLQPLVLDGEHLVLHAVMLDMQVLNAQDHAVNDESLIIHNVPDQFQLDIVTRIKPQENTTLQGLYKSGGMFCTQCEAQGFRRITYFLDRPDVTASYTVTIEADRARYPVLLSNGDLIESGRIGNRHFATWHDPFRKPSYLFALVAGQLTCREDAYTTRSGREIALRIYTEAHNADKCDFAMRSLKKAMRWDEETYDLEYDLNTYMIVAVDDFNMGAMENKGLNIFNSKYVLARSETATDDDYRHIEAVIGHEYFHNWTGNRVTCRDWFQLSLKEGLTVFREQEFAAEMTSRAMQRIEDVRQLRAQQFPEDAGPMAHPVRPQSYIEINNFYTATVYEKGAEVVRMYETLLGRDGFRRGLRLYLERHDGQAATTDDFAAAMSDASHRDFTQFKRWYDQAGTPRLHAAGEWNATSQRYHLRVTQDCPPTPGQTQKLPFHIPLVIGLIGPNGRDMPLQLEGEANAHGISRVLELREHSQDFSFINVPAGPVPSLLRGFSAPVELDYDYSDADLAFLATHDSDPFNRWEALQRLAIRLMTRLIADYQADRPLALDDVLAHVFKRILSDPTLDAALSAETLTLPGEDYLSEVVEEIDVDAIHAAREFTRHSLARALESHLADTYQNNAQPDGAAYDKVPPGRRRLRDLCLAYLNTLDKEDYSRLAFDQFSAARNMTDTMGALHALNDRDTKQRRRALQAFHGTWRHDPLVMDKWFALQAGSALPGTLETVKGLVGHPLFSLRNPNRVRALIGTFSHRNPINFHTKSGAGYRFLADQVLRIDPLNPQMAARLVKGFSLWRKYDPTRRQMMQAQLQRIVDTAAISRDVFEIASKSLA
ncbi:MAG: aminopeptidase N [Pseudomonadota bacterium]|nr:aminopeptidase N [Pseudomonadota bacterium]